MEIRRLTPVDDVETVADILVKSWQFAYVGIVPQDYLDKLHGSRWHAFLRDDRFTKFVAVDGETYAGIVSCNVAEKDAGENVSYLGWGEIGVLYLLPEYYGRGFGAHLMDAAIGDLRERGIDRTLLWVTDKNVRARRFYEKYGFSNTGETLDVEVGGRRLVNLRYIIIN